VRARLNAHPRVSCRPGTAALLCSATQPPKAGNAIARNFVVRMNFCCHCCLTQVEAVQPAPPDEGATHGHATVVTAQLHEAADVWNDQGKKGDSYTSTYKVGPLGPSLQQTCFDVSRALYIGASGPVQAIWSCYCL
jgi:hypothetical protein